MWGVRRPGRGQDLKGKKEHCNQNGWTYRKEQLGGDQLRPWAGEFGGGAGYASQADPVTGTEGCPENLLASSISVDMLIGTC